MRLFFILGLEELDVLIGPFDGDMRATREEADELGGIARAFDGDVISFGIFDPDEGKGEALALFKFVGHLADSQEGEVGKAEFFVFGLTDVAVVLDDIFQLFGKHFEGWKFVGVFEDELVGINLGFGFGDEDEQVAGGIFFNFAHLGGDGVQAVVVVKFEVDPRLVIGGVEDGEALEFVQGLDEFFKFLFHLILQDSSVVERVDKFNDVLAHAGQFKGVRTAGVDFRFVL